MSSADFSFLFSYYGEEDPLIYVEVYGIVCLITPGRTRSSGDEAEALVCLHFKRSAVVRSDQMLLFYLH